MSVTLPKFSLFGKSAKIPWRAPVVAQNTIGHTTYTVYKKTSWAGGRGERSYVWWLDATSGDFRRTQAQRTTSPTKAEQWIEAVTSGDISIEADI